MNNSELTTKPVRDSSVELFRILAIFAVLLVHWNGWFVGGIPDHFDLKNITVFRTGQAVIQSMTCICVNMFLLISGYFGLKLKYKSILNIYALLLCVFLFTYIISCVFSPNKYLTLGGVIKCFFPFSNSGFFIQDYLMLMFFSPVFNTFIDKYKKNIIWWVVAFVMIEAYWGWLRPSDNLGFNKGYSVIHFVLMYFVGRLIFLYKNEILKVKAYYWLIGYITCTILLSILYMILDMKSVFQYTNPIVVLSSVCVFVPFLYRPFYNKNINWIARSVLAVYLLNVFLPGNILFKLDVYLLSSFNYGLYWLISIIFNVIFFFCCILFDKFRLRITKPITDGISIIIKSVFHVKNMRIY